MELLTNITLWMASNPYKTFGTLFAFAVLWRLSRVPQYYNEYKGIKGVFTFYLHGALLILAIFYGLGLEIKKYLSKKKNLRKT
jgi:hypothetical protein